MPRGPDQADQMARLVQRIHAGTLGRRAFLARSMALGLSLSASDLLFRTYRASAQEQSGTNPITVTVGGTPIAVAGEDLANATPGGVFRFGRAEESDNLDPVTTGLNTSIWFFMSIYDQLIRVAADGISLEPALAERWEISEDGLTYTFHLRPNVLFSDGTPMTSRDVVYSWLRAANDPGKHWTFTLTALKRDAKGQATGISAPDDATVVVELARPWAPFLSDVAMFNLSVVSQAFAEGKEARLVEECMGTGPFALKAWNKGESLNLVKNPHYWESGFPLLDEVDVVLAPDDNARILQLQGGQLDGMKDVPSSRVAELQADPNLKIYQFPSTYTQYIVLNTRHAPLNDVHARRALQFATDRQTLIDVVLFGAGIPANSFMPKGALYWNDALPGFSFDLAKAQAELAQSKTPQGFPLELKILAGSADDETLATALKDMWSHIGVDVTITPTETTAFNADFWAANFQAMSNYFTYDIIDPDEIVGFSVLSDSSDAFQTGWVNSQAQDLARRGAAETDPAKRKAIYFQIQELFNQDSPMVILYSKPYIDVTTTRVHNFSHPPTGQYVFTRTWLET
jgi:peptide/nickel transport system substrate-binding protein